MFDDLVSYTEKQQVLILYLFKHRKMANKVISRKIKVLQIED